MKTEDAIATTKILAQNIQRKMKLEEEIKIEICNGVDEISESIKKPFDFILATTVETEILMKKNKLELTFVNETNSSVGFEFYLITKKEQNFNDLKSLKDGSIIILSKSNYNSASVWLDKLLRDAKLSVKETFFKDVNYDYKATNVVLPVYFNKTTAAIVSRPALELLFELNPQLRKSLNIISKSGPILFGVISFDGRSKDRKRKDFMCEILSSLHEDSYGKQLLDLFMVDKMLPFKDEYWQNYLNLYK
ncbi:MAG: PhnD/SsuA/transferrin family substrate-binding protein [Ignavibacteriales bacterium]|nr:PhnD/SsuA/transferrin family substrate-binding protein [Ignavibacteriales bacterium]MBP9119807.1 PhnD/SsuA/transferrin family substrate-binding protein [Ignavibacterium sp.]